MNGVTLRVFVTMAKIVESLFYSENCLEIPYSIKVFDPFTGNSEWPGLTETCGLASVALRDACCFSSLDKDLTNGIGSAYHLTGEISQALPVSAVGSSYCHLQPLGIGSLQGYSSVFHLANGDCIKGTRCYKNQTLLVYQEKTCDTLDQILNLAHSTSYNTSLGTIQANFVKIQQATAANEWTTYWPSEQLHPTYRSGEEIITVGFFGFVSIWSLSRLYKCLWLGLGSRGFQNKALLLNLSILMTSVVSVIGLFLAWNGTISPAAGEWMDMIYHLSTLFVAQATTHLYTRNVFKMTNAQAMFVHLMILIIHFGLDGAAYLGLVAEGNEALEDLVRVWSLAGMGWILFLFVYNTTTFLATIMVLVRRLKFEQSLTNMTKFHTLIPRNIFFALALQSLCMLNYFSLELIGLFTNQWTSDRIVILISLVSDCILVFYCVLMTVVVDELRAMLTMNRMHVQTTVTAQLSVSPTTSPGVNDLPNFLQNPV